MPPKKVPDAAHRRPTRDELEYSFKVRRVEAIGNGLSSFFKWGGLAAIAYCVYLAIDSLSGKTTLADIGLKVMANMTLSKWLAYALGAGGVAYGANERRLRRNAVRRLAPGRLQYEQEHDPQRSSSGLTVAGETNPEEE